MSLRVETRNKKKRKQNRGNVKPTLGHNGDDDDDDDGNDGSDDDDGVGVVKP